MSFGEQTSMRTPFKDKQVMQSPRDHSYFASSDSDDDGYIYGWDKDDVFASYGLVPAGVKSHSRSSTPTNRKNEVMHSKAGALSNAALVSVIDNTMACHSENIMNVVMSLSERLSWIESRACHLENSMDGLKQCVEHNRRRIEGKLKPFEITLKEVQCAIQDMRDEHEIAEAKLKLAKIQASKDNPKKNQNDVVCTDSSNGTSSSTQQFRCLNLPVNAPLNTPSSATQPFNYLPVIPVLSSETFATFPVDASPSLLFHQNLPQEVTPEKNYQQFSIHTSQLSESSAPLRPYQLSPSASQTNGIHQLQLPYGDSSSKQSEGSFHWPLQNYYISSTSQEPANASLPLPFYMSSAQQNNHQAFSRQIPESEGHPGHGDLNNFYQYNGYPSFHGTLIAGPALLSSHSEVQVGEIGDPLPTAQVALPHALPFATNVNAKLGSTGGEKTVSVDDAINEVSAMGFRRDKVRAIVKKLVDEAQPVNLNVILDKLMNKSENSACDS